MSDHILKTIEDIREQMAPLQASLNEKKRFINQLCALAGVPLEFSDSETSSDASSTSGRRQMSIRPDQFFGRPLATIAREYLEMRKSFDLGPASIDELFEALKSGGCAFEGSSEDIKKRGLAISLSKNSTTFVKVPPNDAWGLTAWYPGARRSTPKRDVQRTDDSDSIFEEDPQEGQDAGPLDVPSSETERNPNE